MSAVDIFFDTNVLLYLLSADAMKANLAEELLKDQGGIVSVQVLNEFVNVATRKLAMSFAEVREILSALRTLCVVKPLEIETHELGLELAERYRYSIYDCMILAAALRAGCSTLYSEDFQHEQVIGSLTIRNPFTV
jgi:predicted nucleic acid-binding protein